MPLHNRGENRHYESAKGCRGGTESLFYQVQTWDASRRRQKGALLWRQQQDYDARAEHLHALSRLWLLPPYSFPLFFCFKSGLGVEIHSFYRWEWKYTLFTVAAATCARTTGHLQALSWLLLLDWLSLVLFFHLFFQVSHLCNSIGTRVIVMELSMTPKFYLYSSFPSCAGTLQCSWEKKGKGKVCKTKRGEQSAQWFSGLHHFENRVWLHILSGVATEEVPDGSFPTAIPDYLPLIGLREYCLSLIKKGKRLDRGWLVVRMSMPSSGR